MFWRVVIGLLTLGAIITLATLWRGSRPVGSENLIGQRLPDFAAPLASGTRDADANIYTRDQAEAARSAAACDVRLEGVFNSCRDLTGRAVLMFWNSTKRECADQAAALDRFARGRPRLSVAAVAFDQQTDVVRRYVVGRGWRIAVPIDRDGAVAALYAVAGCPTTFFADKGKITGVELGTLTEAELSAGIGASPETGAAH